MSSKRRAISLVSLLFLSSSISKSLLIKIIIIIIFKKKYKLWLLHENFNPLESTLI